MESWHRVGQRVVCIIVERKPGCGHGDENYPINGNVYTIRYVYVNDLDMPCFYLEEIVNKPRQYKQGFKEFGFWASSFCPVKDTSIESLRAILSAPPDPVLLGEEMDAVTDDVLRRLVRT